MKVRVESKAFQTAYADGDWRVYVGVPRERDGDLVLGYGDSHALVEWEGCREVAGAWMRRKENWALFYGPGFVFEEVEQGIGRGLIVWPEYGHLRGWRIIRGEARLVDFQRMVWLREEIRLWLERVEEGRSV